MSYENELAQLRRENEDLRTRLANKGKSALPGTEATKTSMLAEFYQHGTDTGYRADVEATLDAHGWDRYEIVLGTWRRGTCESRCQSALLKRGATRKKGSGKPASWSVEEWMQRNPRPPHQRALGL